jgi:hypothetical protein
LKLVAVQKFGNDNYFYNEEKWRINSIPFNLVVLCFRILSETVNVRIGWTIYFGCGSARRRSPRAF